MLDIRMETLSRAEESAQQHESKRADLVRLLCIERGSWEEPQYALVIRTVGTNERFACTLRRDALLAVARAIQQSLAPTREDQILDALQRIEGQLSKL